MNDVTQNLLNEVLKKAIDTATTSGQWLAGQIPDVVNQLLLWKFWQNAILAIVFAVLIVSYATISYRIRNIKDYWDDTPEWVWIFWVVGGVISSAMWVGVVECAFEALQIAIAPKVWLLEYAAHLVGKS